MVVTSYIVQLLQCSATCPLKNQLPLAANDALLEEGGLIFHWCFGFSGGLILHGSVHPISLKTLSVFIAICTQDDGGDVEKRRVVTEAEHNGFTYQVGDYVCVPSR